MLMKRVVQCGVGATLGLAAVSAFAQASVTLYGIVDTSITYQNSQTTLGSTTPGKSNVRMQSGVWNGDRWGLRGTEDLGGGNQLLFVLESGFNLANGGQQFTNAMFGRQARIDVSDKAYGTLSLGRQYSAYYTTLSPWVPAYYQTGYGSHPGDLDGMDTYYRSNNAITYTSPLFYGLTATGQFAPAGGSGKLESRLDVERRSSVQGRRLRSGRSLLAHQQLYAWWRPLRHRFFGELVRSARRVGHHEWI